MIFTTVTNFVCVYDLNWCLFTDIYNRIYIRSREREEKDILLEWLYEIECLRLRSLSGDAKFRSLKKIYVQRHQLIEHNFM